MKEEDYKGKIVRGLRMSQCGLAVLSLAVICLPSCYPCPRPFLPPTKQHARVDSRMYIYICPSIVMLHFSLLSPSRALEDGGGFSLRIVRRGCQQIRGSEGGEVGVLLSWHPPCCPLARPSVCWWAPLTTLPPLAPGSLGELGLLASPLASPLALSFLNPLLTAFVNVSSLTYIQAYFSWTVQNHSCFLICTFNPSQTFPKVSMKSVRRPCGDTTFYLMKYINFLMCFLFSLPLDSLLLITTFKIHYSQKKSKHSQGVDFYCI